MSTRCIFLGGFLGAGKTTTLMALAQELRSRGCRVGAVLNDQGTALVDSALVTARDWENREVTGGCFCCRFDDLGRILTSEAMRTYEVVLCEPVGSCTDLVATVIRPLLSLYGDDLTVSRLLVIVDSDQWRRLGLDGTEADPVAYIYGKQLEEADVLVLNKIDLLSEAELGRARACLKNRFPGKEILCISARRGDQLDELADFVLDGLPFRSHGLSHLDYDRYAQGEAELGWLNVSGKITKNFGDGFLREDWACTWLLSIRDQAREKRLDIAHLKVMLQDGDGLCKASLLAADAEIAFDEVGVAKRVSDTDLLINARVRTSPENLGRLVHRAILEANRVSGTFFLSRHEEAFSLARPVPTHRLTERDSDECTGGF